MLFLSISVNKILIFSYLRSQHKSILKYLTQISLQQSFLTNFAHSTIIILTQQYALSHTVGAPINTCNPFSFQNN